MLKPRTNFVLVLIAILAGASHGRPGNSDQSPRGGLERTWQRDSLELTLSVSDVSPLVSDRLSVALRVVGPAGTEIELPKLDDLRKTFELSDVKTASPSSDVADRNVWELHFGLEVLQATQTELPPLTVRYRVSPESSWVEAATESIPIEFRSMLGSDADSAQPKPNPEPMDWPHAWFGWFIAALAVMLVLLAIGAWLVRSMRSRGIQPIARVSPYQKALEGIRRIEAAGYLERGELERFYTELSGVIRYYIEDRFRLRAPEQTTEEFLQELTGQPILAETQRDALGAFLEKCDLVKFAKARPTTPEGKSALSAARGFIEATRDDSQFVEVARAIESGPGR